MAREEFISPLYLQHATSPELLSPARAGPAVQSIRFPVRPLLAALSRAGLSLMEHQRRQRPAGRGALAGSALPRAPVPSSVAGGGGTARPARAPRRRCLRPSVRRGRGSPPGGRSGAEPGGAQGPGGEQPVYSFALLSPKLPSACCWTGALLVLSQSQKSGREQKEKQSLFFKE